MVAPAGRDGDVSEPFATVWLRVVTRAGIQPNHDIWRFSVTDSYAINVASLLYEGANLACIAAYRSASSRRYVPAPARQPRRSRDAGFCDPDFTG
jgi:hypothetical protein